MTDAQIHDIEQQLSTHPEILQALYADQQKIGGRQKYISSGPSFQQGRSAVLQQYGINFPDAGDYQIQVDPQGHVKLDRNNWFQRNADWILPVATIGGGAIANAFAGGSAATPAATGTSSAGPVAATGGTTAATVPPALAAGGSGIADVLKKLALGLAPVGAGLAAHALGPTPPQPPQVPDELKQLLALAMKRASDQQPLVDRVNAGQLAGLPRLT